MLGLTDDYQKLYADGEQTYKKFGFSDQDMFTLKATLTVNNFNAEDLFLYSQRRYLELCQVARVTPSLLSRPSMSIMSNGNYVMPSHVVTLWECLWKMTHTNQWCIVKI